MSLTVPRGGSTTNERTSSVGCQSIQRHIYMSSKGRAEMLTSGTTATDIMVSWLHKKSICRWCTTLELLFVIDNLVTVLDMYTKLDLLRSSRSVPKFTDVSGQSAIRCAGAGSNSAWKRRTLAEISRGRYVSDSRASCRVLRWSCVGV